uniref:Uncharacterized protein n=1 Tax=Anguilla anguilla TaxID=7936 RepID=A0A0E9RET3_ANGAN
MGMGIPWAENTKSLPQGKFFSSNL